MDERGKFGRDVPRYAFRLDSPGVRLIERLSLKNTFEWLKKATGGRRRNMIKTKLPFYRQCLVENTKDRARLPSSELYASISDFSGNWARHFLKNIYESAGMLALLRVYRNMKRLVVKRNILLEIIHSFYRCFRCGASTKK